MTDIISQLLGDSLAFASSNWARRPLLHRAVTGVLWRDLLTLRDVDNLLWSARSDVRFVAGPEWADRADHTRAVDATPIRAAGPHAQPGKVYTQFSDGATAVLVGLHESWPPLARICNDISRSLTIPVQANAYVSPPHRHGTPHHDNHDVIVLQLHGTKRWRVWAAPIGEETAEPEVQATLSPGDCLYVPRQRTHAVATEDRLSVHVTFGIAAPTWEAVLTHILKELLPLNVRERALPAGFAGPGRSSLRTSAADVLEELRASFARLNPDELTRLVIAEFWQTPEPAWDGQLLNLSACEGLSLASRLRRRSDVSCNMVASDGVLRLDLSDRSLEMPADLVRAIELVTTTDAFDISDLTEYLDLDSALVLVRRLIREGLLRIETSPE